VDEDVGAGALDEPGSIVLVDGGLVSFPAGDAGELVLDQAGVLCAYTMARGGRERSKGRGAKGCARRGCGVRRGCHAGRCPLLLQRSRAGRGGRTGLGGGARDGGGVELRGGLATGRGRVRRARQGSDGVRSSGGAETARGRADCGERGRRARPRGGA